MLSKTAQTVFKCNNLIVIIDDECLKIIKEEYQYIDDFIDMLLDSFDILEVNVLNIFYDKEEDRINFKTYI